MTCTVYFAQSRGQGSLYNDTIEGVILSIIDSRGTILQQQQQQQQLHGNGGSRVEAAAWKRVFTVTSTV